MAAISADAEKNIVKCYYESIPKLEVSVDDTDLVFGDAYTITAKQDMTFAMNTNEFDAAYYHNMAMLIHLAGACDEIDDSKIIATATFKDGTTESINLTDSCGSELIGPSTVAIGIRGGKTATPYASSTMPAKIELEVELRMIAAYDEDAYSEDSVLDYDVERKQWIGNVDAVSLWEVPTWQDDDASSPVQQKMTSTVTPPISNEFVTNTQLVRSTGATEVRIADGAHVTVEKFVTTYNQRSTNEDWGYYRLFDRVPFTITVTNDGQFPVTNVIVKDDMTFARFSLYDAENMYDLEYPGYLMPGETAVFSTDYYVKKADIERGYIENVAYVDSIQCPIEGVRISSTDGICRVYTDADVTDMLDVTKEIVDQKDNYRAGDEIEYRITIENNTDTLVQNSNLYDYFYGAGDRLSDGTIERTTADGETMTDVFKWGRPVGWDVVDFDDNEDTRPRSAETAEMFVTGGNTDAEAQWLAYKLGFIEPGEKIVVTTSYTVTDYDMITNGYIYNSARVTGFDAYSNKIEGWNDCSVSLNPATAVTVSKKLVGHDSDYVFSVGEDIVYDMTIANTGDFWLKQVVLQDVSEDGDKFEVVEASDNVMVDESTFGIAYLEPGQSETVRVSHHVTEYDVGSTFEGMLAGVGTIIYADDVTPISSGGDDERGDEWSDDVDYWYPEIDMDDFINSMWPNATLTTYDTAEWSATVEDMKTPALNLTIGTNTPVVPGNPIVIDAIVENTSNVTIENVVATDANGNTVEIGTLAPGEKKEISFKDTADKAYTNKISVEGTTAERRVGGNETVTAEKEASVDVRADKGKLSVTVESDKNGADAKHSFDVVDSDGNKVATLVFTGDSKSMSVDLPFGDYVIKHSGVADGTVKADDVPFTIAPDADEPWNVPVVEKTVTLSNQTGVIEIDNVSGDAECPDATYTVTDEKGNVVAEGVGAGKISELAPGTYVVKVDKAPEGYKPAGDTEKTVTITSNTSGEPIITEKVTFEFTPLEGVKTGTLIIESTTGEEADENNTLSGAEYDLIADEDIVDADGNVLYKKGDKVKTILGEDVKSIKVEIPVGTYKLVEVKAPDGFEPSEEPEKFFDIGEADIIVNYVNMPTPAADEPAGDDPQEPSDDSIIPDTGNDMAVPDNGVASSNGIVSQMGDNALSILFAGLAAACLIAGIVILRRKAQ